MINANGKLPSDTPDPTRISLQMRINADIIMDEISQFIDKELDRLAEGVGYIKDEITRHVDKQCEKHANLYSQWVINRDKQEE